MNIDIMRALIGVGGTLLGTLLTVILEPMIKGWLENRRSSKTRLESNVPEIMGSKWSADWRFEDGSEYVKDIVTFDKWTKRSQFEGYGEVTHKGKQYKYSIAGEVSPARIVVLTYKAERFPLEANIGMACLQLSVSAQGLDGTWAGVVGKKQPDGSKVTGLCHGTVKMEKIKDVKS